MCFMILASSPLRGERVTNKKGGVRAGGGHLLFRVIRDHLRRTQGQTCLLVYIQIKRMEYKKEYVFNRQRSTNALETEKVNFI